MTKTESAKLFTPPDPSWRERCLASFAKQAMMRTLGVEVGSVGPGEVVLAFDRDDRLTQQHGFIHAGVLGTVLDSACGWAALSLMPVDHAVLTVEYKLNLLRPATGERFEGRGRVVKPGRTLTVAEGVLSATGEADRPLATMTATLMAVADRDIED
ncbi:MAG: PaaI family thioesterase [Acidimicrobiales bacterium]|nr:PaaI family thioesterase [Acidimicrobiales bacterium]